MAWIEGRFENFKIARRDEHRLLKDAQNVGWLFILNVPVAYRLKLMLTSTRLLLACAVA